MADPISIALFVISTAYSYTQAQKAKRKAEAAADAAKGFEFSVEGEATSVPVVYGRNLVGGVRAYHNVSGNYVHAAITGNGKETMLVNIPAYTKTETRYDGTLGELVQEEIEYASSLALNSSKYGDKNSFLYVQQVLSFGEIAKVWTADIDSKPFNHKDYQHGQRIHIDPKGGVPDQMITANFPDRANAKFTHTAFASMVFQLNRDDPQYGGTVPNAQFYMDGVKISRINRTGTVGNYSYAISTTKYTNNNPAYVLLDYLTNTIYGRGLTASELDLESFYNAAQVCDKTVRTAAPVTGRIWQAQSITTRNVPLYECNIVLDTAKSIRDNIEDILLTMGDAVLVWTGGKYKLQLQYPETEAQIILADELNDDNIVRDSISVKYPSASERKNRCTIRFRNEAEDFKDDSVSWPPRYGTVHTALLAEDNGVPLETDITANGIVDQYHALAKAEEIVRYSRASVTYKFKVHIGSVAIEPGDIVKVNSAVANIVDEYMKINEVTFSEDGTASVVATKYDYRVLAWNADDDQVVSPRNNYDFGLTPPGNVTYTGTGNVYGYTSGKLTWTAPPNTAVLEYIVYAASDNNLDGLDLVWFELGRSNNTQFEILGLSTGNYVFKVVAVGVNGRRSSDAQSTIVSLVKPDYNNVKDLTQPPAPTGFGVFPIIGGNTIRCNTPTYTVGHGHRRTVVMRATYTGTPRTIADATLVATFEGNQFTDLPFDAIGDTFAYWIAHESIDGVVGLFAGGTNGQLGTAQPIIGSDILAGAIDRTKFANDIEAVTRWTGASLPTTFQGSTILWTVDNRLYYWTGTAYSKDIQLSEISDYVPVVVGGGNLLTNSGFELNTVNAGSADDWQFAKSGTTASMTRTMDARVSEYGHSKAQRIAFTSMPTDGYVQIQQDMLITNPPEAISTSFQVWGAAGAAVCRVVMQYATAAAPTTFVNFGGSADYPITTTPTRIVKEASSVPTDAAWIRLRIRAYNTGGATIASGYMVLDNAQVEAGSPTGYAPKPGELIAAAIKNVHIAAGAVNAENMKVNKHMIY